jgi:rare lipoprotein A
MELLRGPSRVWRSRNDILVIGGYRRFRNITRRHEMRERIAAADLKMRPRRGLEVSVPGIIKIGLVAVAALLTANCASQKVSSKVDPKYGVAPSPIRVSDGENVPKGGGRAMVGRPYTIAGRTFVPKVEENYSREGLASWYGRDFHGRQTANGEIYDKYSVSAAHPTMPLPSYARVTNLSNNRSLIVRVNDRGPFHGNRIIDVSRTVAEALDFRQAGVSRVRVDYVGPASMNGSDDRTLISTLRSDGRLAQLPTAVGAPVMVAAADPARSVPSPAAAAAPAYAEASVPARQQARFVKMPSPPVRPARLGSAVADSAPRPAPTVTAASRTSLAGIFFAEPARVPAAMAKSAPFENLAPLDLASLRRTR